MSWLNDIEREFKYECEDCGELFTIKLVSSDPTARDSKPCSCGSLAQYAGFLPTQLNLRGKVSYDQNGRKAYQITDGKGNVRYVSATKQHYLETGDIKPQYTKGYVEHLKSTGKEDLLEGQKYDSLVEGRKRNQEIAKRVKPGKRAEMAKEKP